MAVRHEGYIAFQLQSSTTLNTSWWEVIMEEGFLETEHWSRWTFDLIQQIVEEAKNEREIQRGGKVDMSQVDILLDMC